MKSFLPKDISRGLSEAGVKRGDVLFFSIRLFGLGRLLGCRSKEESNRAVFDAIFEVLGDEGTLVVPTYSQQIGRFTLPYVHEETPALTGVFCEYVRKLPGAVRSFHPVFSLTAVGRRAYDICGDVGTSAFGVRSAYDHLFRFGGQAVCAGFEYERGDIVTGAHYVECTYGVPYYYNKIVRSAVYRGGEKSAKVFTINVRYRDFAVKNNYLGYVNAVRDRGLLREVSIGEGVLYASDLQAQLAVGYDLLSQDVYAFLEAPPQWREGVVPFEGSSEVLTQEQISGINWEGFHLHRWGQL